MQKHIISETIHNLIVQTTPKIAPSPGDPGPRLTRGIPWTHPSLHPKLHVDRVGLRRFSAAHRRVCLYFTMGRDMDLGPTLINGFLGSLESTTQTASRSVQPLLQGSRL